MYGGQSAGAMGAGFQQGFALVDNAVTAKQSRELKAQEASNKAKLYEKQLTAAEIANDTNQLAYDKDKKINDLQTEMVTLQKQFKKVGAKEFNNYNNEFVASVDPKMQQEQLNRFKTNAPAEVIKSLGVQNIDTARLLTENDNDAIKRYMMSQGVTFTGAPGEQELVDSLRNSGLYINVDGQIVDMSSLTKLTGGVTQMTPAQKAKFEEKQDNIVTQYNKLQVDQEIASEVEAKKRREEINAKYEENQSALAILDPKDAKDLPSNAEAQILADWNSGKYNGDKEAFFRDLNKAALANKGEYGEGGGNANPRAKITALNKQITDLEAENKEVPQALIDERDFAEDTYNKEFYAAGGAKSAADIRKHQSGMTPAQKEDDNKYRGVKDDKGLIKKWDAANDAYDTAKTFSQTRDKVFDIIENSNIDWNAASNASSEMKSYADFMFDPDATDKEKLKAYAGLKTHLGAAMADYIKSISGAAVSESERSFLMDTVFGGMWKDRSSLEGSLNAFIDTRITKADNLYKEYGVSVKPNKSKERVARMDKWRERKLKPYQEPVDDGKATVSGVVESVVSTVKEGIDYVTGGDDNKDQTPETPVETTQVFSEKDRQQIALLPDGQTFTDDATQIKYVKRNGQIFEVPKGK